MLSVIIPTKDRPETLPEAVSSAAAGLPNGGEIIVVDDGNAISASRVLEGRAGPETTVIDNPGRCGPSAARNAGAAMASQPVLIFLDDDDRLVPEYCRRIFDVVISSPDVVYGSAAHIRKRPGRKDLVKGSRDFHIGRLDSGVPLDFKHFGTCGLWVLKAAFLKSGGFDEDLVINEDTELCIRLARNGAVAWYDREPGFMVFEGRSARLSPEANLSRRLHAQDRIRCYRRILDKHGGYLAEQSPRLKKRLTRRIWKYWIKSIFQRNRPANK